MKKIIISISRTPTNGIPDTFIIGQPPIIGEDEIDGPPVSKIKFFETSNIYGRIYRGPGGFYVVEFEGSTIRRLIPANVVIDIAVETQTPEQQLQKLPEVE